MTALKLYGTFTSPYVRRVGILAHEFDLRCEFVDTTTTGGQAGLRAASPLWKVPTAELIDSAGEGSRELLFDSRVIGETLVARLVESGGSGPIAPLDDSPATKNLIAVIDGALDSLINVLYLGRDGITPDQAPYLQKQTARAAAAMAWLESQLAGLGGDGHSLTAKGGFGLPEISLATTLAWMNFRNAYPVAEHPALAAFLAHHDQRPSMVATRPPG